MLFIFENFFLMKRHCLVVCYALTKKICVLCLLFLFFHSSTQCIWRMGVWDDATIEGGTKQNDSNEVKCWLFFLFIIFFIMKKRVDERWKKESHHFVRVLLHCSHMWLCLTSAFIPLYVPPRRVAMCWLDAVKSSALRDEREWWRLLWWLDIDKKRSSRCSWE